MRFADPFTTTQEDTRKVRTQTTAQTVEVRADGEGVSHAGAFLLTELADWWVSPRGSRRRWLQPQAPLCHDPGVVLRDLAVAVADGGDCLSDLAVLRGQEELFGPVASESTAHRALKSIDAVAREAIRAARAKALERAWDAGARPETIMLDIDASLLSAHSEKESVASTYKNGFGFHPLLAYFDETSEDAAAMLGPGNAGANTAADQIRVAEAALEQIPADRIEGIEVLLRVDSAGASHELLGWAREGRIGFSVGYEIREGLREAIEALPERRERAHPGAQLSFTDADGHRFQAILTDQAGTDIAAIERRHRARARLEDQIRHDKDTGLARLPFREFALNAVWLGWSASPTTCSPGPRHWP